MKTALIFALGIASTAAFVPVHAQTYQWKDGNGRTVISDTPQPGAGKPTRVIGSSSPAPASTEKPADKVDDKPKTNAEKEMDFKKRQQETKEKSEKEAKEQKATADKQQNCERTKGQLALLESGQRVSTTGSTGERRFMEDSERQQEIERSRKIVADNCK